MSEEVMRKHIELYVNDFSLDLGDAGKTAVQGLLNIHQNTANHQPLQRKEIFLSRLNLNLMRQLFVFCPAVLFPIFIPAQTKTNTKDEIKVFIDCNACVI